MGWRRFRRPSWAMIGYGIGLLVILGVLGSLALSKGTRGAAKERGGSEEGVRGKHGKGGKGKKATRGAKKKPRGGRVSALTEAAQPRTIDEANVAEARLDPGSRETSPPFEARQDPDARRFIREAGENTHALS